MEHVGLLTIIKLTWLIFRKNCRHFVCIAIIVWLIPSLYAKFVHELPSTPVLDVSSFALDALVGLLWINHKLIFFKEEIFPPSVGPAAASALPPDYKNNSTDLPSFPELHLSSFFPFIASFFFLLTISLICYPLLTFSVCRACLNKRVCLKGSLLGVVRSAKNLVLTSLCMGALVFGFTSMTLGVVGIIAGTVVVITGNESVTVVVVLSCIGIAMAVGALYLTVLFSLAPTAAILEEKTRGWGAMKRSMDLVKGRKWLALGLVCVLYATSQPFNDSKLWRWRGGQILRESLQATVALFGMAANVVLYMSCKRHKQEPLTTLVAASAQFGPQAFSYVSQTMDIQTDGAFLPT